MKLLSAEIINRELQLMAEAYSDMAQFQVEGYSGEHRTIGSLRIGSGERTLICTGGVHGREIINPNVLLKMAKYYIQRMGLLKEYGVLMLPLVNPDGYELARQDYNKADWKYNAAGIDINRDFPCVSYVSQASSKQPFSAVESRILAEVFKREESIGYIDFHSRGKEIYWYRKAMDEKYNQRQKIIARALCQCSGYHMGTVEDEMPDANSGGNTVQYYSEQFRLPAITVETVDEDASFPLDAAWLKPTWQEVREIPLQYIRSWSAR